MRALKYWERQNLLSLVFTESQELCEIHFLPFPAAKAAPAFAQKAEIVDLSASSETVDNISINIANISTESVKNSVIDNVEVKNSLSVSFDNVKNTKEEYLSSLHNVD